jgi:gamma-glutamyltranspeptidase/glutathione hydrolase
MVQKLHHFLTGFLTVQSAIGTPVQWRSSASSSPAVGVDQLGAVASESDICSRIGTDLLKLGGNAADAMVGTVVCVGVVGMYHSGKIDFQLGTHITCRLLVTPPFMSV